MPRTSLRLTISLALALIVLGAAALNAAPAPPSAETFLGELAPCRDRLGASAVPGVAQPNAPVNRVLYSDCGYNCSDSGCSGGYTGSSCYDSLGRPGSCLGHNVFCSGEYHRSPCTCEPFDDCIPTGGEDDVLYNTNCCSGQAQPGSTWCDNPADYGTTWASCHQICA